MNWRRAVDRDRVLSSIVILVVAGWVVAAGCRVDDQKLYDRVYGCTNTLSDEQCGTTRDGRAMTCFPGYQLGADDFCAERCQPDNESAGGVCLSSGVKLASCRPSGEGDGATCPTADLSCLRTDLLLDEGVCAALQVCTTDRDCTRDPARSTCLGTLLREGYGNTTALMTDHLYCLQTGCSAEGSSCPSGEVCLPRVVARSSGPPDICVPKCDAQLNCPPNHFCYRKVSGPAAPQVCIPGFLGAGCTDNNDCLMGRCLGSGPVKICTIFCTSDAECAPFSRARGPFVCADLGGSELKICMNPVALGGAPCGDAGDCKSGEICTRDQPILNPGEQPSECRRACTTSADCPPVVGIAHSCVRGMCFPGRFSVPCQIDGDCISDLRCLQAPSIDRAAASDPQTVCSFACATDADCAAHVLAENTARCQDGVCRRVRPQDAPCERDDQCVSRRCRAPRPDVADTRCE